MTQIRQIRRTANFHKPKANLRPIATVEDGHIVRTELARARVVARSWVETIAAAHRVDHAAAFVRQALETLAAKVAPALTLSFAPMPLFGRLDRTAEPLARSVGEMAAQLPLIEALYQVTSVYPALLPAKIRGELGAFYTPPALVTRLFEQAEEEGLDWRSARILDPAAGGGVFLLQAVRRMIQALPDCEPAFLLAQIGERLVGFEVDPHAAGLTQAAVEILLADIAMSACRPVPRIVKVCDTLDAAAEPIFDLVIGNPPYGRITLSPDKRQTYARSLYGHANLYGLFTDAALRWTKPGGLVAYLTPTSFLAGQYFAALRRLIAEVAPPVSIDFIHSRSGVFEDVQQETLLAVYKRGATSSRARIHYLTIVNDRETHVTRNGTIALPADCKLPWLAPRSPEHSKLIASAEMMNCRLADWGYSVSTGPLVWNRFKDQLRDRPDGKLVRPLIWAESITSDGRFLFRAQKKNHSPYFALQPGDDWLLVTDPCVLVQRTTAKEQARRLIAAELPFAFVYSHGGVVVENHLNMIRAEQKPQVQPAVLAALLGSGIVDQLFRCISGSVAVSAYELEALPLPAPAETKQLAQLVSAGASRTSIDAECTRLYGQSVR